VLLLGILKGILLAAVASILFLIHRSARPHVAFLGRIPGTRRFSDLERNPENEPLAHAIVFRVESSLLYYNVDHVAKELDDHLRAAGDAVRLVVGDLSASPIVDLAGGRMLEKLHDRLAARGITLRLVEARSRVRDLLRALGLEGKVGSIDRFTTVADLVERSEPGAASS
jgi:SulP family sulfate permease